MIQVNKVFVSSMGEKLPISDFSITKGIGKGYNTATLSGLGLTCEVGDDLDININGVTYRFLIVEETRSKFDEVSLLCQGKPSILDDEVLNIDTSLATNSVELIDENKDIITVVNNLPIISFNEQTYTKSSTSLARILDMVDVVGGEAYEVDGVLFLDEFKTIPNNPIVVETFDDVIDYSFNNKINRYSKLKSVSINPEDESLYSTPDIKFNYEGYRGEIVFNPSLSRGLAYSVENLNVTSPRTISITEVKKVLSAKDFKVDAGVDSITSILLDGELFTEYETFLGTNIIKLNSTISGTFEITYITKGLAVNISSSNTKFLISYQCMEISDEISIPDSTNLTKTQPNISCISGLETSSLTYENGGVVKASLGADLKFVFSDDKGSPHLNSIGSISLTGGGRLTTNYRYTDDWSNVDFLNNISSSISNEKASYNHNIVFDDSLNSNVAFLNNEPNSVDSIYYGSEELLGWSVVKDGLNSYIDFGNSYNDISVTITIEFDVVLIQIPAPLSGHEVKYLDVINCGGLTSHEFKGSETTPCSLPATIEVNVADEFNLSISEVSGKIIKGDLGEYLIDSRGVIVLSISNQEEYTLTADSIVDGAKLIVDSRGVKYA